MRKQVLVTAALAVSAFLSVPAQADTSKTFEGRKLFNSYCYLCHGVGGKGDGPLATKLSSKPKDLVSSETRLKSDRELLRFIQGSLPHGKDMPKWGATLPEPDVAAIVAYIRFMQRAEHPLIGDPETGRGLYDRYCVVCHGDKGQGNGQMTSMLPIQPADHTDAARMNRMNNNQLINYIANGGTGQSYMPGWEGILNRGEIEAVVSYIRLLSHN